MGRMVQRKGKEMRGRGENMLEKGEKEGREREGER